MGPYHYWTYFVSSRGLGKNGGQHCLWLPFVADLLFLVMLGPGTDRTQAFFGLGIEAPEVEASGFLESFGGWALVGQPRKQNCLGVGNWDPWSIT